MEIAKEQTEAPKLTEDQQKMKEVTDSYFQLCAKRGDLHTKQDALEEELDKIRLEIHNLNVNYKKLVEKMQKTEKTDGISDQPSQNN
jgi:hypothetical protein